MAKRVWIFQQPREKKSMGAQAPWTVGWYEGKQRRSKKIGSKTKARDYARRLEEQLNQDPFSGILPRTWDQLVAEYKKRWVDVRMRPNTRANTLRILQRFGEVTGVQWMTEVTNRTLDDYVVSRAKDTTAGKPIQPTTINGELRVLRAFLNKAVEWRHMYVAPKIHFLPIEQKWPTAMDDPTFLKLYLACEHARLPRHQACSPCDWWRALLTFYYLTGWRRNEPLALLNCDLNRETGKAMLKAEHTKERRDVEVPLHPVVWEHLDKIRTFGPHVFSWPFSIQRLHEEFHHLQDVAEVKRRDGRYYGFHDFRRGFASMNALNMSAEVLQTLMRHRSYHTTQRYIDIAQKLNPATVAIHVPELPEEKPA